MDINRKRALLFVLVTFALTWAVEFGVIWPAMTQSTGPLTGFGMGGMSVGVYALISCMMFMPLVGMLITRIITKEGMRNAWIKPTHFKKTWPWWLAAWLGTFVLVAVGGIVYFLINPSEFDPSMTATVSSLSAQYASQGITVSDDAIRGALYSQFVLVGISSFLNLVPAFGEEWGWRGYLLPKLLKSCKVVPALIIMGVIWGLWHLPLTMLGHNYGTAYEGYPFLGIACMCWFCFVVGVFLSWLTLKTGSCIPAALAHAGINGSASAAVLFSATGGNALIGPAAVGVVGSLGFTFAAIAILVVLHNKEKGGIPLTLREEKPDLKERPYDTILSVIKEKDDQKITSVEEKNSSGQERYSEHQMSSNGEGVSEGRIDPNENKREAHDDYHNR